MDHRALSEGEFVQYRTRLNALIFRGVRNPDGEWRPGEKLEIPGRFEACGLERRDRLSRVESAASSGATDRQP
jgi:hypothetical protein